MLHRAPIELPRAAPELTRRYRRLSLRDVFLSLAGYRPAGHPLHRAIASLSPGDWLQVRTGPNRRELVDRNGTVVGQLAGSFEVLAGMRCAFASVLTIATWDRESSDLQYQDGLHCDTWEVVVPMASATSPTTAGPKRRRSVRSSANHNLISV